MVDLPEQRISDFCAAFPMNEFYLSDESVLRAVRRHGICNIIHPASGLKIDVMIPTKTIFNHNRFERKQRVKPKGDYEAYFASAEDIILKKMDFFREGSSDKHLRDITGILKVRGDQLDFDYIESWADQMGLETIWRTILRLVKQ